MDHKDKIRYARHIIIPQIGARGQEKLMKSKVFVLGAGGLGSPALFYLAASGVGCKAQGGYIKLCDNDTVEITNLQRQIIHETSDIGRNKAESAKDSIADLNSDINVRVMKERINKENIIESIKDCDLVIDGSDNYETRFLVNDACIELKIPLISAAILKFEGQIAAFRPYLSEDSPCYRCLYEDVPPEGTMPNCSTNGIVSPVAGIMGSMQALYAINIITGNDEGLDGFLTVFDSRKNEFRKVKLVKEKGCGCN